MSHRKELQKLAKREGFELIRSNKHFVYKKNNVIVTIPNHNKMPHHTYKGIIKQLKAVS